MFEILEELDLINRFTSSITIVVFVWMIVVLAVFCDLWDGIYTANKLHEKIRSHKMRRTTDKICEYWRVLFLMFLIDLLAIIAVTRYNLPYASIIFGASFVGVEIKSMFEHIKRRKSGALKIADVLEDIIKCSTHKDAKEMLKVIKDYLESTEK